MRLFTIVALALAIGLATAVSPLASTAPDGLNRVASDHAFEQRGTTHEAPVSGYAFPGVHNEKLAKGLAGFTGTLLVFALGIGLVKTARRRPATA
jgi:PDGLE domain